MIKINDTDRRKFIDFEGDKAVYVVNKIKEVNGEEKRKEKTVKVPASLAGLEEVGQEELTGYLEDLHRQVITDTINNLDRAFIDPEKVQEKGDKKLDDLEDLIEAGYDKEAIAKRLGL